MKTDSLAAKAYNSIREKILANQLSSDTRLKEDLWAKKLQVSRIAVREALTRLLGEGLVRAGERGGYFVMSMSPEDVHQIKELREILELGALKLAAERITEVDIHKLEKICAEFSTMVSEGYFSGACEADVKFHETLIKCARNKKLLKAYVSSHIPIFHQKIGSMQIFLNDYDLTDKEHRQIVKALKERNFALANKTLKQHLNRGEVAILEEL